MQEKVDRAGFFRWGAAGVKRMGSELLEAVIGQWGEGRDTAEWARLADEKAVGSRPWLKIVRGSPYFVLKRPEEGVTAFSAACPVEGGLLEWRDHLESFCCPFCRSEYNREGKSPAAPDIALAIPELRIVDGQVMVRLELKD